MRILVGDTRSKAMVARLQALGWGRMFAHRRPTPWPGEAWGLDNGAFNHWRRGEPFDGAHFRRRLRGVGTMTPPVLAVAPDIVAGGMGSLWFSREWLPELPVLPWYLAVQDGMSPVLVEPHLSRFRGLFLGGSDEFKATAGEWAELAHGHGLPFHYGRAGTLAKLRHARAVGADSLDSAFPLWTVPRFEAFAAWVAEG